MDMGVILEGSSPGVKDAEETREISAALEGRFVSVNCKKGYLDIVRQLKCWSGHFVEVRI